MCRYCDNCLASNTIAAMTPTTATGFDGDSTVLRYSTMLAPLRFFRYASIRRGGQCASDRGTNLATPLG